MFSRIFVFYEIDKGKFRYFAKYVVESQMSFKLLLGKPQKKVLFLVAGGGGLNGCATKEKKIFFYCKEKCFTVTCFKLRLIIIVVPIVQETSWMLEKIFKVFHFFFKCCPVTIQFLDMHRENHCIYFQSLHVFFLFLRKLATFCIADSLIIIFCRKKSCL